MNTIKARELRKNPTESEQILWKHLRLRQLGGYKFRRQQPLGPYFVDFVCLEKRLIVEVDGGQHSEQVAYDSERSAWLEAQGFRILRFWNNEVLKEIEVVKEVIAEALGLMDYYPHLSPPPIMGEEIPKTIKQSFDKAPPSIYRISMPISEREMKLIDRMLSGDRVALARLITLVESRHSSIFEILKQVNSKAGKSLRSFDKAQGSAQDSEQPYIIGITGPPGAGKSTLANELIISLRKKDKKLGVVAVDPSSPFTGGAVLGDRIRMQDHTLDENVFIRSLGSRGSHGGLSKATKEIIKLYDAFGMDYIIIETVGVGQTELDIIQLADSVLVVLVPEAGDVVQTMKAGLMEIGDIFIVNKADREGADKIAREIKYMTSLKPREDKWDIPVVLTSAHDGRGVEELVEAIEGHKAFQSESSLLKEKREKRREEEFSQIISEIIERRISERLKNGEVERVLALVKKGEIDPYEGAELVLSKIL